MNRPQKNLPDDVANIMPMQGHVFEGKFRVVNLIGAGGFARVFHARFEDVGRDVALKVLVPQSADPATMYPEELVQRFHREARAVSELRSPNTITLHDFGRTRGGLLYMVFEYVDGTPLDRLIKTVGAIPAPRVVHIIRQVLLSLREAHAVGMLHRDIKPANVMIFDYLDQQDLVKLLDFGIAKTWTHDADGNPILEDLTEDGTVMGTPRYMSPEQIVGQRLSPQSDLYSLGLLAFEMLTGAPAAPQTEKTQVVRQHLGPEPFILPPDPSIPPTLRSVVDRMLAKDIRHRYQTVDEALADLEHWNVAQATVSVGAPQGVFDEMAATQASGAPEMLMSGGTAFPDDPTPNSGIVIQSPMDAPPTPTAGSPWTGPAAAQTPVQNQYASPTPSGPAPMVTPPHTTAQGQMLPPAGPKPDRTFIQVRATPAQLEIDVPLKPTKRALLVCGATFIPFFLAFVAGGILWMLLTGVAFAWGLSLVFATYRLRISPQQGYEVTHSIFSYDRSKRGPIASVVRFESRGADADENTVLKLVTHEGEFTVANSFSEAEHRWVANEGNSWIAQLRAANPQQPG